MTLYIYSLDNNTLVARIHGDSNDACEAANTYGDDYGATYTPAFGATDGLVPGDDVVDINA